MLRLYRAYARRLASGLFLAALLLVLFGMSMGRRLDHDEHQFVAAGALLARRALWPYRDYAYFHTPNLVMLNALVFRASDHLLLASRVVSTVAGFLAVLVPASAWNVSARSPASA